MIYMIQFKKVTWYSKWLALALVIALPFIGFYFGMQYQRAVMVIENFEMTWGATRAAAR